VADLPKYSDNKPCIKCGCTTIKTKHMPEQTFFGAKAVNGSAQECMLRTCARCEYTWQEAPLNPTNNKETENART